MYCLTTLLYIYPAEFGQSYHFFLLFLYIFYTLLTDVFMKDLITLKITELIERAPKGWAEAAATTMNKKCSTIYAYAKGGRCNKTLHNRTTLKAVLQKMVEVHEKELEDLLQ